MVQQRPANTDDCRASAAGGADLPAADRTGLSHTLRPAAMLRPTGAAGARRELLRQGLTAAIAVWGGLQGRHVLAQAGEIGRAAPAARREVVIGYSGPLSGGGAYYGRNVRDGIQLALDAVNAGSGLQVGEETVTLTLQALDDRYDPAAAAGNVQRLIRQYGARVVLVPHSGGALAVQVFNEREGALLLTSTSVPRVTQSGNALTVRTAPVFTRYIPPFVERGLAMGRRLGLVCADHDYGKAWAAAFRPAWTSAGGEIVADNLMSYTREVDYYSALGQVLAQRPEVLLLGGPSEATGVVVRQARELGFKGGLLLIDQANIEEVARIAGGMQALNTAVGVLPLADDPSAGAVAFRDRYHKAFEDRPIPGTEAAFTFGAVLAVAGAMRAAGRADDARAIRAGIGAAWAALPADLNPGQVTGVDEGGGVLQPVSLAVVENARVRPVTVAEVSPQ